MTETDSTSTKNIGGIPAHVIAWLETALDGKVTHNERFVSRREGWLVDVACANGDSLNGFLRLERFEDDKIKVWEFNLEPGEQTAVHTHEMEYVFYVIKGSTLEVFDADNKLVMPLDFNDGDVLPLRLEGDELVVVGNESLRVPARHSARNPSVCVA